MSHRFRLPASLVLNTVLAVTVVVMVLRPVGHRSSAPESTPAKMTDETPVFTSQPKSLQYTNLVSVADRRRWLIDQLRAAGVSRDVLARVAQSDLEVSWEKRFEVAEKNGEDPDAMHALQLEHDMKKDAEMRAALGEEDFKQWDQENMLRETMSGKVQLTTGEADTLYDLKKKLQQHQFDLELARVDGTMDDAEISEANDKAYTEFDKQMKGLLGDDRYAKSQKIDEDSVAENLRHDLVKANPSDSQFQDLLKAQQELDKRRAELGQQTDSSSPEYAAQIKALDEARDQEYQHVLGTNVFETLQKQQDPGYTQMQKYKDIWGLDDNKIDSVYGSIKYYEKSVQDYRAQAQALAAQGQDVDWNAVNKNLQQFTAQTQQALQNQLGQTSFNRMQQNGIFQFDQTPLPDAKSF